MRVLIFCPQFHPVIGGAERQAEKLAAALHRRGLSVSILTPLVDPTSPNREVVQGVVVHRIPLTDLSRKGLRGIGWLNLIVMRRCIRRAVRALADEFDVLHAAMGGVMSAYAVEAAAMLGKPATCKLASSGATNDLSAMSRRSAALLMRHVARWIGVTSFSVREIAAFGAPAERIVQIPNGVALSAPDRRCSAETTLVYIGRLSSTADRDIETLLKAFALSLRRSDRPMRLVLVGGGDDLEETRAAAATLGLSDRVEFVGWSDPDAWLRAADIFVLPSRTEGLSNALLEAMAAGVPCIANDIPPNREVLRDGRCGMLPAVGGVEEWAAAIGKLVAEPDFAASLAAQARQVVEEVYDIDVVAARYHSLYVELLSESKGGSI